MTSENPRTNPAPRPHTPDQWLVVAMVQPFKLDVIVLTLTRHPAYDGMTLTDCRGLSAPTAGEIASEGERDEPRLQTRLELLVTGRVWAEAVADAIAQVAHTGRPGDGTILILPVQESTSIREFILPASPI